MSMRTTTMVMGLAMTVAAMATTWTSAAVDEDAEILRLREAAWRAWFSADEAALRRILPADFIGIGMKAGRFATLDKAIEDARAFHATGARLTKLEFPETQFQRYGDVVILYGRYLIEIENAGQRETSQGRLTEMFLKHKGAWVHTGWHLDTVTPE